MKLALGTVQFGQEYGIANEEGALGDERVFDLLEDALALGIQHFDTSPVYGKSEERLGRFFEARDISDNQLVTKVKFPLGVLDSPDTVQQHLHQSLEGSLGRLRVDNVHGLLLHLDNVELLEKLLQHEKILIKIFKQLREQGKIEKIGVSVSEPEELTLVNEVFIPEIVQFPLNLFDRRFLDKSLQKILSRSEVECWARSCFLQGLFFLSPEDLPYNLTALSEPLREFQRMVSKTDCSTASVCMAFTKQQPWVDYLLVGVENHQQLTNNCNAFEQTVDGALMEKSERLFNNIPQELVDPRNW